MDVGGHFCPFALGLMIGFTEKNAKEEAETSLLNSPPLPTTTGVHQDVIEPFVVSSTVESDHTWICYSTNSKRLLWPRVYWHGTLQASDIPSPSKCLWGAIRKISEAHHPRHAAKLFSGCHPQLLLFYLWQISSDCE